MQLLCNVLRAIVFVSTTAAVAISRSRATTTIGSTGVIGAHVLEKLVAADRYDCFASYRTTVGSPMEMLCNQVCRKPCFFQFDFTKNSFSDVARLKDYRVGDYAEHTLINAAGVCIQGSTLTSMRDSLCINSIGPLTFAQSFITTCLQSQDYPTTAAVINISSGEGELCLLHSDISSAIQRIQSLPDLLLYSEELVHKFDAKFEYAFGGTLGTPMYSLSKAILNRGTALLHEQFQASHPGHVRVLACCPGNVASPMSTPEELLTAIHADQAAHHIVELVSQPQQYPGGKFYRNGESIPW